MPKSSYYEPPMELAAYGFIRGCLLDLLGGRVPLVKGSWKISALINLFQATTLLDVIDRGNVSIISEGDAVGLKLK